MMPAAVSAPRSIPGGFFAYTLLHAGAVRLALFVLGLIGPNDNIAKGGQKPDYPLMQVVDFT